MHLIPLSVYKSDVEKWRWTGGWFCVSGPLKMIYLFYDRDALMTCIHRVIDYTP